MKLLRADLLALCNLPRDRIGRRLLLHLGIGLGLLALLSYWLASSFVAHPELIDVLRRRDPRDWQLALIGMGLLPCPITATWLGLSLAQRQMFDTPELDLWECSPLPAWRGPLQIFVRSSFLAALWAAALSAPFLVTLLLDGRAPLLAYALLPVAIVTGTAPLMATLLVVQVALVRLFASRLLRLVLTSLGAIASAAFSLWLLVVLFGGSEGGGRFVERAADAESLPATVDAGARLLRAAAQGQLDGGALRTCLWWLLFASALFWLGARMHPRALEAHRLAEPARKRRRGRGWPASVAATIRKKELAQVLQQPGALVGFLIFAFLVFALVERQVLVGGILADHRLPIELRHLGAMLAQWFLATMLVLYPHMGRLVQWEATQWPLYVTAPAAHSQILRGKLEAVFLLLLWPLVLVAAVSGHALEAAPRTLGLFFVIALGGLATALGVLALVGTTPILVRPDEGGNVAQGGRGFFASLVLVFAFKLGIAPAAVGWIAMSMWARRSQLSSAVVADWTPAVLALGWAWALFVFGVGFALAVRNYGRLAAPRA